MMTKPLLQGRRILLVEDEYVIAEATRYNLEQAGASVIGPAASVEAALILVEMENIDGALLDVSLGDQKVFPVAEALAAGGIPFMFVTGYSSEDLPAEWQFAPRSEKPVDVITAARLLAVKSEADFKS